MTSYRLGHGEAVAIGMVLEARLAERSIGFPEAHTVRLVALLEAFGLPTRLPAGVEIDALISTTYHDKKARGGRAFYALPRSIGRMPAGDAVTRTVDERTLRELLVDAPRGPAVRGSA